MLELQFITHANKRYSHVEAARIALSGGCKWIQLRMKGSSSLEIEQVVREVQPLCRTANAKLILNDHVILAKKLGVDGVHLGQNDLPICEARELLGPDFLIGGTANTLEEMLEHTRNGVDYIGLGPFRYTKTKAKLAPLLGIQKLQTILQQYHQSAKQVPVVVIGGITLDDLPTLVRAGITGVAISGSILQSNNPKLTTQKIIEYHL